MQREYLLCRAAIYPKFINLEIFDDQQFFYFHAVDDKKTCYAASVASKWLLRDEGKIHNYGWNIAEKANTRSQNKESYYLGYFEVTYYTVAAINMQYYSLSVHWRPEDDCDAHFQIEMHEKGVYRNRVSTKNQRRNDRIIAVHTLSNSARGTYIPDWVLECEKKKELIDLLPIRNFSG